MKRMFRTMNSQKLFWGVLFFAALALCAVGASAAAMPSRRQDGPKAFEKAEKMRAALEAQPEIKRRKEQYQQVIDAYNQVGQLNPASNKIPLALAAIAELYRQMGNVFSTDSYFLDSVRTYRVLADQYPKNHLTRDALYTVGEIYQQDLEDPDEARKAFKYFVAMYPQSEKAEKARNYLTQLDQLAAERGKAPMIASPPPPPALEPAAPLPVEKVVEEKSSGLRHVTAVRRWVGPNYMRIVIETDGEVKFDSVRLSNPDRIVVNLQSSRVSPEMGARTVPVEDGFLRQIRVAQFSSDVSRVVLDVKKIEAYSIFSLPNPFRLVIDVQGTAASQQLTRKDTPTTNLDVAKTVKVAPPLPTIPAPKEQVEAEVKPPTPAPAQTATPLAPSAPPQSTEEVGSVKPASDSKPHKRSKAKTETVEADVLPAIQPAGPTEDGSRTLTRALGLKIGRIVIDPGHGGHDTGTLGPTGLEEKDVVLDVGLKLRKLLQENTGCEVVMTRSDDTFIPLEERTAIANEKSADLFISIHANASPDDSARGIETYYLNFTSNPDALEVAARENASSQEAVHQLQDLIKKIAMTEKIEESQDFASQVQHEVYTHVTKASGAQRDRGIKKAPFVVLIGANMPSVLAEISFLTNPKDEHLLRRSEYREKIAEALYEGITDYLKTLGEVKGGQRVAVDQPAAAPRTN